MLDFERSDGFREIGSVAPYANLITNLELRTQRGGSHTDVREVVGDLADRLFGHTKMSSGSTADTTKLGTSTTSLIFRSTATEQIAYACWRE